MGSSGNSVESEKFFRTVLKLFKVPIIRSWIRKQMRRYAEGTLDLAPVTQENYPSHERFQPWETCMTMGQSWAFNPNETIWKSPGTLVHNLSAIVGHGGNYLLNVGPTDKGVFPSETVERLEYIGKWMDINGEAIYETRKWEGAEENKQDHVYFTKKGNDLYVHCTSFPTKQIEVKGIKASNVKLLGVDSKVKFKKSGKSVKITAPTLSPISNPSQYAWVFKIENAL